MRPAAIDSNCFVLWNISNICNFSWNGPIAFLQHFATSLNEPLEWKAGYSGTVWPDWAIFWTLGNFLKPLATINLPQSSPFLGNFCKGVKIFHFSSETIFGQLLKTFGDFYQVTLLRNNELKVEREIILRRLSTNWFIKLSKIFWHYVTRSLLKRRHSLYHLSASAA